jgi:hypothetical protein
MRCHLRFATSEAYDSPTRARMSVVERSVEEYSLAEPIGVPHDSGATERDLSETADPGSRHLQPEDIEEICANPLRDEPHPAIVGAVKRFGLVGLVTCALGTGLMRWWKSLTH